MLSQELRSYSPTNLINLYEIDATSLGISPIFKFHNGINEKNEPVVWQGETFNYFPIKVEGFEMSGKGTLPRPMLTVANVTGVLGTIVNQFNDLVGAKFIRRRTFMKYLDAINFPEGNPTADPSIELPLDIYYIDRKSQENKLIVEFELAAAFDLSNVQLPRRQIIQNLCVWKYRGAECGYAGTNYYDINDKSTASISNDVCSKKLTSCEVRFGQYNQKPYGGFPAAGLIR